MAFSNKECVIVVMDVRPCANEDFKLQSVKSVAEMLKYKICSGKQDYVSFVLLGTQETYNDVNTEVFLDGYMNIKQYPQVQLPTWQLLINFFKFVNETACDEGEWLDAVVVAMEMLKKTEDTFRFQRKRIVLFYDFNNAENNYDMYDCIAKNILEAHIEFIVISHNIQYIDNPETGEPKAIFREGKKSKWQRKNEECALKLVTDSNAKLCNFEEALRCIFKVENQRPWTWNSVLSIGSKITIYISGLIVMKDESNIKLKKCWGQRDETITREWKSYVRGNEIEPLEIDLIDAYMLGSTPIPYDETLQEDKVQYSVGLKFIGFTKRDSLPSEYFCSDSLYCVVHQKGRNASAKKLDALVKVMRKHAMVMLCWRVYSAKFNTPKIVVLLPNQLDADKPATLTMVELAYHSQYHYFQFPKLCTTKTECTSEQLDAINNLIDAMDLTLNEKEAQQPRDTFHKDLLPFDALPHIYEQNVMDVLERKIITNVSEDDELFQQMLEDKNFVEVYWKVPELREQGAKRAANAIKKIFPLHQNITKKEKIESTGTVNIKSDSAQDGNTVPLDFCSVGRETPADDFTQLLQHNVMPLQNRTERDVKFLYYAKQLRAIIWESVFKTEPPLAYSKIAAALQAYRQSCYDFNSFDEYNKWIRDVRTNVEQQKCYDFWRQVMLKHNLGLCFVGGDTLESKKAQEQFYNLKGYAESVDENEDENDYGMNDEAMNKLLASV